jgi:hypothetical protein
MVSQKSSGSSSQKQVAEQTPETRLKNALRNLQLKYVDLSVDYNKEVDQIEAKYWKLFEPLFEQRAKIVNGEYEPTEEESEWKYQDVNNEIEEEETDQSSKKQKTEDVKGLPDFWLKALQSAKVVSALITKEDEPVLSKLHDLGIKYLEANKGFILEFVFNENEYFTNQVLTKTYEMLDEKNEEDPLLYEGPSLVRTVGCPINWKPGKNITVKIVEKKQKNKSTGKVRVIKAEEKKDSFFSFFDMDDHNDLEPEEADDVLKAEYAVGHYIKDVLVPKAVLYFTGEVQDDQEDEEGDDFKGDEDDEDDDE